MTHKAFVNSFLSYNPYDSVELKLAQYMKTEMGSQEMFRLRWLGLFDDEPVGLDSGTPAQILEHIAGGNRGRVPKKPETLKAKERELLRR